MDSSPHIVALKKKNLPVKILNLKIANFPTTGIELNLPYLTHSKCVITTTLETFDSEKIKISRNFAIRFLKRQFITSITPAKITTHVDEIIPIAALISPTCSQLDGPGFKALIILLTLAKLVDDIFTFDGDNSDDKESQNDDKIWIKVFSFLNKFIDSSSSSNNENDSEFKDTTDLDIVDDYPQLLEFFSCVTDIFTYLRNNCPCKDKDAVKPHLVKKFGAWIQNLILGKMMENPAKLSDGSYRNFKTKEFGGMNALAVIAIMEGIQLRDSVAGNPFFVQLLHLAESVGCMQTDILQLKKSFSEDGSCSTQIQYKFAKGGDINLILQQEIALIDDQLDDYLQIREIILRAEKGSETYGDIFHFIALLDSWICGYMHAVQLSEKNRSED